MSVVLLLLVFKVLVCVGAVAVTGVRVVSLVVELDATIEEEGDTVVSWWFSDDDEAQPMVGAGVLVGEWGRLKEWVGCHGARCTVAGGVSVIDDAKLLNYFFRFWI